VRQAVERLTRDGLVSPQRGRGTFVTGAPSNDRLAARRDVAESLADVYRDTHPTILNIDESTRSPGLDASDGVAAPKYVYMRRVHAHQGPPVLRHRHPPRRRDLRAPPTAFRKETGHPAPDGDAVGEDRRARQV
jgi:GntR family transcriptional regulator